MITEIGIVAGDIWHYLDQHQKGTLDDMVASIKKPKGLILMGLGWLAREGHVTLVEKSGTYEATLTRR